MFSSTTKRAFQVDKIASYNNIAPPKSPHWLLELIYILYFINKYYTLHHLYRAPPDVGNVRVSKSRFSPFPDHRRPGIDKTQEQTVHFYSLKCVRCDFPWWPVLDWYSDQIQNHTVENRWCWQHELLFINRSLKDCGELQIGCDTQLVIVLWGLFSRDRQLLNNLHRGTKEEKERWKQLRRRLVAKLSLQFREGEVENKWQCCQEKCNRGEKSSWKYKVLVDHF